MDLLLALMPLRLIRTLTRTTSEKVLISFLMALGLLATAIMCIKMTTFNDFGKGDPMQATIKPSMLAKIEEQIGIIAVCLPCLKSAGEKYLKKIGILKEHQLTRPSFVNTVALSDVPKDHEKLSSRGSSIPRGNSTPSAKLDLRVDSVSTQPGISSSPPRQPHALKMDGWEEV
jgi:hypothetical protein